MSGRFGSRCSWLPHPHGTGAYPAGIPVDRAHDHEALSEVRQEKTGLGNPGRARAFLLCTSLIQNDRSLPNHAGESDIFVEFLGSPS